MWRPYEIESVTCVAKVRTKISISFTLLPAIDAKPLLSAGWPIENQYSSERNKGGGSLQKLLPIWQRNWKEFLLAEYE